MVVRQMKKANSGITLLELIIGFVIVGIIMTLAASSLVDYFRNSKVRNLADELQADLQNAKYEAIKRNGTVNLTITGTRWITTAIDNTGQTQLSERTALSDENNLTIQPANLSISFNSQGRLTGSGGNITVAIRPQNSLECRQNRGNIRCLQINIQTSGQLKLCDPALDSSDPRGC